MKNIYRFSEVDSTNSQAIRFLRKGLAQAGDSFVANTQTNGRGRLGRNWVSLEGNLHLSIIVAIDAVKDAPALSFIASLSIYKILHQLGLNACCKWPNDVLVSHKKIAGILIETLEIENHLYAIIGIGLNIAHNPMGSTSIQNEGLLEDKTYFLEPILNQLNHHLTCWKKNGFDCIVVPWIAAHCVHLGHWLKWQGSAGTTEEGYFEGIDSFGALMLKTNSGQVRIVSGEIVNQFPDF